MALVLQGTGTLMDVANEMEVGDKKEVLNILKNDSIDVMLGEFLTSSSLGQYLDVIGAIDLASEVIKENLEIN